MFGHALLVVLKFLFVAVCVLTWRILTGAAKVVFVVLAAVIQESIVGRHRWMIAPFWLAVATLATSPWPALCWIWLGLALLLAVRPWREARGLSERERVVVARVLAGAGALVSLGLPLTWSAAAHAGTVLAGAVFWWPNRRVRPDVEPEDIRRWREEVVPKIPELAGSLDYDAASRTAVLDLRDAMASQVVNLDERVEWALNQQAGTVILGEDPGKLTRRQVRIAWATRQDAQAYRFWDGPTLDMRTGLYVMGDTYGARKVNNRVWRPGGAVFFVAIGPPGSGKGGVVRTWALECGLSDLVRLYLVDGKSGAGIPEVRGMAVDYATTKTQWRATVAKVYRIMESRERRYGAEGRSRFTPGPGEPVIALGIDEGYTVIGMDKQINAMVLAISGRGRSLGVHLVINGQHGGQETYGNTKTRANMLSAGTLWAGPTVDSNARQMMRQDYQLDLTKIPREPGWALAATQVIQDQATEPMRGRYISSRQEVEEEGAPDPFGCAEDWWARAVHPQLHPDDAVAEIDPDVAEQPMVVGEPDRQLVMVSAPAPAVDVEARESGPEKVRRILNQAVADGEPPLHAATIATKVGLTPRRVNQILKQWADENPPVAVKTDDGWKAA